MGAYGVCEVRSRGPDLLRPDAPEYSGHVRRRSRHLRPRSAAPRGLRRSARRRVGRRLQDVQRSRDEYARARVPATRGDTRVVHGVRPGRDRPPYGPPPPDTRLEGGAQRVHRIRDPAERPLELDAQSNRHTMDGDLAGRANAVAHRPGALRARSTALLSRGRTELQIRGRAGLRSGISPPERAVAALAGDFL